MIGVNFFEFYFNISFSNKNVIQFHYYYIYAKFSAFLKEDNPLLKRIQLLKTTFKIKSMEKVAEILGVTYGYARKKKSQCMGKLTQLVKDSNEFHQLKAY